MRGPLWTRFPGARLVRSHWVTSAWASGHPLRRGDGVRLARDLGCLRRADHGADVDRVRRGPSRAGGPGGRVRHRRWRCRGPGSAPAAALPPPAGPHAVSAPSGATASAATTSAGAPIRLLNGESLLAGWRAGAMSAPQARNGGVMAAARLVPQPPGHSRSAKPLPSCHTGDWPVVGRDDELAAISAGLRRGVGCVVVGEPGVGKTIVLRELRRRLAAAGRDSQLVLATTAAQSSMPQSPIPATGRGRRR